MRLKVLFFVLAGFYSIPAYAAPIVLVSPPAQTVMAGGPFSVDIRVTDAVDLYGFEFDLGFAPAVAAAVSVTEGPFLGAGGSTFFFPGTIDNTGGSITFVGGSLLTAVSGVSGSGTLATVQFDALASGVSPITLFNVLLLDSQLSGIQTTVTNGSVNITPSQAEPIPEPTTLLLIGAGLVGLERSRRFRRRDVHQRRGEQ